VLGALAATPGEYRHNAISGENTAITLWFGDAWLRPSFGHYDVVTWQHINTGCGSASGYVRCAGGIVTGTSNALPLCCWPPGSIAGGVQLRHLLVVTSGIGM
jgi:hypothetical protein